MYKNTTALTTLRFVHKVTKDVQDFLLYPNSALFIDLDANRLYTHEIVPPMLEIQRISQLDYVIRCSNCTAEHKDGQTYVTSRTGEVVPLRKANDMERNSLKNIYMAENTITIKPEYGFVDFTLNDGDLLPPKYDLNVPVPDPHAPSDHQD